MATDFAIEITGSDREMTFDETENIMNNVYLSLMTDRGAFFQNPEFGSRLYLLKRSKNTEQTASLARSYCKEALQWLIRTGRAAAVEVYSEIDKEIDLHRLKLLVEVTQRDGQQITFTLFKDVA
jgi:phage gp46-like protein